ncbi:hypothetical protein ABEB36_001701 [Hypothenemus hampei]|uniref:Uncharacterized protein n=1 Tax=Hypothenemus hampei TaxID=57062 RepID=A0ABD1FGF9_HYPHA
MNNLLQTVREDDFVEYYVFPEIEHVSEDGQQSVLESLLSQVSNVIDKYTKDYLWHKDPIKFVARTSLSNVLTHIEDKKESLPPHLYGVSHYGDNIEDEWFIVFLLQTITNEIPGLIAKVHDSDGEFILIEAADYLPQWANPETCENRVYIFEGKNHLVAPQNGQIEGISTEQALKAIRVDSDSTVASTDIQNSIQKKISSIYPPTFHHATIFVPSAIASILNVNPNLISSAIQAFCNRDPIDLKACRAMKYFPPEQRVRTRVKFTRCLYAMLSHSRYLPDKKTGWNLPSANSKDYKEQILGVRVACGFEILASQAKPVDGIEGDRGWTDYLKSLNEKGYFEGLLEGCNEYTKRIGKAKEYYLEHRESMYYSPAIGREILRLLRSVECDYEKLKKQGEQLPEDDSDSWLDVSPEELDKMLQDRYGKKNLLKLNENTDATHFAQKVNSFLNHVSDLEGAEFPSEDTKTIQSKKKKEVSFAQAEYSNRVNFDPDAFTNALQNILNFTIPEDDSWDLDSDSDMDEYEDENDSTEPDASKKTKLQEYMDQMDVELASTTIGQSFQKKSSEDQFDDIENFQPVDIDVNALKNILESYKAQLGEAGPSTTMLGPMGVHLDNDN